MCPGLSSCHGGLVTNGVAFQRARVPADKRTGSRGHACGGLSWVTGEAWLCRSPVGSRETSGRTCSRRYAGRARAERHRCRLGWRVRSCGSRPACSRLAICRAERATPRSNAESERCTLGDGAELKLDRGIMVMGKAGLNLARESGCRSVHTLM